MDVDEESVEDNVGAPAIGFYVSARVLVTVSGCKAVEMEFIRGDDGLEKEYWVDEDEIRVLYKLPPFRTKAEVVEFVEKKGSEFIKKKK